MNIIEIKDYRPYERMNMVRTRAGKLRYDGLIAARDKGFTHVQIGTQKVKTISGGIKSCSHWQFLQ